MSFHSLTRIGSGFCFAFFFLGLSFVIFKGIKFPKCLAIFLEFTFKKFPNFCCCHNVKNYYPKKKEKSTGSVT